MIFFLNITIFDGLQGDHNHLFIRQGTGLQGQAVFRTKLTFRPHSTESFTHRKMTLSLADRSSKSTGIKVLSQVGHDPDAHRGEMIKVSAIRHIPTGCNDNNGRRILFHLPYKQIIEIQVGKKGKVKGQGVSSP